MPVTADRDLSPPARPARNVAAGAGVPVGLPLRAREPKLSGSDKTPSTPYVVFVGLDVGKGEHHACALNVLGERLHDKALTNDEAALRQVLTTLASHADAPGGGSAGLDRRARHRRGP